MAMYSRNLMGILKVLIKMSVAVDGTFELNAMQRELR
jgi:hypothetical protein